MDGSDHGHSHGDGERCDDAPIGLTRNERMVWETLKARDEPLKAYEILDCLKNNGVRAPMTVYRALDGLEAKGLIHKLEGKNSYVLCNHSRPHRLQVFLVCDDCPTVTEIDVDGLDKLLAPFAKDAKFKIETARLEVRGRCDGC